MRILILAGLTAFGCGSRVDLPTPSTTTDAAVTDTATVADSGPVECVDRMGRMPASLKACNVDSDCDARTRQADCCGSLVIVGIGKSVAAAFTTCETERQKGLPLCDCLPQPTKTEDGIAVGPEAPVAVRCTVGACMSFAR